MKFKVLPRFVLYFLHALHYRRYALYKYTALISPYYGRRVGRRLHGSHRALHPPPGESYDLELIDIICVDFVYQQMLRSRLATECPLHSSVKPERHIMPLVIMVITSLSGMFIPSR